MSATQTTAMVPSSTQGPIVRSCIIASAVGTSTTKPTSEASIGAALDRHDPWAVVNAAGWVRVDEAESHALNARLILILMNHIGDDAVLAEFGVTLPESTRMIVRDSTAEIRYLVVPMRPAGTTAAPSSLE